MLDIYPRTLLPKRLNPSLRLDYIVLVSSCVCLAAGTFLARHTELFPNNLIYQVFLQVREIAHPATFPCPFCGGTRSFISCCRGDYGQAIHYSLVGFAVFWMTLVNIPLRTFLLRFPSLKENATGLKRIITIIDSSKYQLMFLLSIWFIQVILHFAGLIYWHPALPFK